MPRLTWDGGHNAVAMEGDLNVAVHVDPIQLGLGGTALPTHQHTEESKNSSRSKNVLHATVQICHPKKPGTFSPCGMHLPPVH